MGPKTLKRVSALCGDDIVLGLVRGGSGHVSLVMSKRAVYKIYWTKKRREILAVGLIPEERIETSGPGHGIPWIPMRGIEGTR